MDVLQRATTVRLVQMLAGGSRTSGPLPRAPEAARHRAILERLPATAGLTPPRRANDRFDEFVLAVAGELRAGSLVNYQARRTALSDWALEEGAWQRLAATARARTDGRRLGGDRTTSSTASRPQSPSGSAPPTATTATRPC